MNQAPRAVAGPSNTSRLRVAHALQKAAAMLRLGLLVRTVRLGLLVHMGMVLRLPLAFAAALLSSSTARADDGGAPGLTLETTPRGASEPLPRWDVHLGGGAGAARASMLGDTHGAVALSVELEAIRWSDAHTGFGLYLGEVIASPWNQVEMDSHPVIRELPWMIEPEIVHRSTTRRGRWISTGWTASLGAGVVATRTLESWSHLFQEHAYEKTLEHGVAAGTTAQLTAFVHAGPVAVAVGPRASADTAGDLTVSLQATAGASW